MGITAFEWKREEHRTDYGKTVTGCSFTCSPHPRMRISVAMGHRDYPGVFVLHLLVGGSYIENARPLRASNDAAALREAEDITQTFVRRLAEAVGVLTDRTL